MSNLTQKAIMLTLVLVAAFLATGCHHNPRYTAIQGPPGLNGLEGSSPVVTTQPAGSGDCLNGGVVILSNNQPIGVVCNGVDGAPGSAGVAGANGVNATPITFVQFCPNSTPSYPSTFPEFGILDGTTVYGVYSTNGGFLAELPPGTYSSDGVNASCTFVINADGTIN